MNQKINIDINISEQEIDKLINSNKEDTIVILPSNKETIIDEKIYLNQLKRIFEILKKHNRTYNIHISIKNRELLKQSGLLNYPNINLTINNDLYNYTKEEYLKEEEQLETLIKPIKEANLSPYEKYLAIYNLVKQFKPYKENEEDPNQSRYIRYILNNEYIVCVGYSNLLKVLLDKVGIPSIEVSASVDTSKYNDDQKNIPTFIEGHRRNIIKIDDDKYNIHGYFIVDPTWDNNMEHDLYNNSTSTFDKRKEHHWIERLEKEDLLLDFHNIEEFKEKINHYLKRKINNSSTINPLIPITSPSKTNQEKIVNAYISIYKDIMQLLIMLDYPKYKEFYDKYNQKINKMQKESFYSRMGFITNFNFSLKEFEELFSEFLTEYALYIIPLSNQKVDIKTTLTAAEEIKQKINKLTQKELQEWKNQTIEDNIIQKEAVFPYIYNPNNPKPNYLESKSSKKR